MKYEKEFAKALQSHIPEEVEWSTILQAIEKPKYAEHGDLAFPCFPLAKIKKTSPSIIASNMSKQLQSPLFEKVEAVGGYINVFLNKNTLANDVIGEILTKKNEYGNLTIGEQETVTIDFSSPNIAKPFSMGHLRSTVIGNSLAHLYTKIGYRTVRINHLGDWGTQFGKLIAAYKHWGDEEKVKANPIKELLSLYVKFHEEAETNLQLEQEGREWFKKLEDGNKEALTLWEWFQEESLKEFSRIYELMSISFDSYAGEAFYNDKMEHVVQLLEKKQLLIGSDSAQIVSLENEGLPPCLIKKADGATLYATRDLAAALYRHNTYKFQQSVYVVGNEQSLHFKQIKLVLEKMGYSWANDLIHVPFGMMLKEGKKMSTRKGKVVLLEEVLHNSINMALQMIELKNPNLKNKRDVAKKIGVGAIIFHDLKNDRMNDIEFSLEDMIKFEGETGPYVQYTNARAYSILRKAHAQDEVNQCSIMITCSTEWNIVTQLRLFPTIIKRAVHNHDPSQIAKYVIDLSQAFNKYYAEVKILEETNGKHSRLAIVQAVHIVLEEGLRLLGIEAPREI
ncbi:arginine--tRNA ligase [Metabacillus iocasae]|uniref:Arginine--tRNA ligase n=1 Tax=Priestia iocasae TaxID=2291674 RepID=A0ABS2QWD7_9BACI|nr:arginine--tRNA ligase [Metabacillus iocasae]MBM7703715.1 arginyl-tRNA synthetase [Metabacillus iocasae]